MIRETHHYALHLNIPYQVREAFEQPVNEIKRGISVLDNPLKNNLIFALLFLIIFFALSSPLSAEEAKFPVNIDADTMDYDSTSDVYHAQGSVVITYKGGVLTSDEVEYDKKNETATAIGNAFLRMGEDTLKGDKIVVNVEDKTGVVYNGKAFYAKNHFYIQGAEIQKTGEQSYKIIKPVATTCDGDKPDWQIAGSEMKVTIEGYGLMKNARLTAGNVPFFYTPFLPFPAKTKRQSGFLFPYLAYSKDKDGFDIEVPFFWAISPDMDATFYQRYIEKRGFKEGVEFRYYIGQKSYGTFYGDYLDDRTYPNTTSTLSNATNRRWSYYLNHQTNFDTQTYLRTDLRRVSDNWYFRDFSSHNYYLDHYSQTEQDPFKKVPFYGNESLAALESTVRFYKGWSNYNLTALVSSTDNLALTNNDTTLQKYPEITFTGIKQSFLKSPLYYEFAGTYDYFYRGEGQKGHFIDVNPTFSIPFSISRYAKIIPQLSLRETFWSRDDNVQDGLNKDGTRSIYNFSLAMTNQISRIFDTNILNWNKVRHEIKPELTYSYTPNVSQTNLPDFAPIITPTVLPVTAATTNAIMEQNAVQWGLTNTFTAKTIDDKGNSSYLEFLRVKLLQTYDINEAKRNVEGTDQRRYFSDMAVEVDFKPHPYLSFAARNQYSVYNGWKVMNYDAVISDRRGDSATLAYRYTLDSIEEFDVSLKAVITDKLNGTFISRRDLFNSRNVENTLGLVYYSQCWALGFEVSRTESLQPDSSIASDTRFVFKFSLNGLAKFGL